jgi:hypothetical protein
MNSLRVVRFFKLSVIMGKSSAFILPACLVSTFLMYSCNNATEELVITIPEDVFTVSGSVEDKTELAPMPGVSIQLTGTDFSDSCVTGPNGEFSFIDIKEGIYKLYATLTPESMYFLSPDSLQLTVNHDRDLYISSYKYSYLFLENNSLKTINRINLANCTEPMDRTDNLLSSDLAPSSVSDRIKLKYGSWLLWVFWYNEELGYNQYETIGTGPISDGDSVTLPLSSIFRVRNNSSKTLFSIHIISRWCKSGYDYFPTGVDDVLEDLVLPGTESEDIHVRPALDAYLDVGYYEGSDTNYVQFEDYSIPHGDSVIFTFE